MNYHVTNEKMRLLSSLHFWRRNQLLAQNNNDTNEVEKSHKTIIFLFQLCDKYKIPFKIQNSIIYYADKGLWFSDIKSRVFSELNKVGVN